MIKLKKVKKYSADYDYTYKDWTIEKLGGFISVKNYLADNQKLGIWFWQFKLTDVKNLIEKIENNPREIKNIEPLYRKSLYL